MKRPDREPVFVCRTCGATIGPIKDRIPMHTRRKRDAHNEAEVCPGSGGRPERVWTR